MRLRVKTPGALSTIQDEGRFGYQQYGVPVSGAVDPFSFQAANLLVGNPLNAPVVEMTVIGPTLEVLEPGCVAITGADLLPAVNRVSLPNWQSTFLNEGDVLHFRGLKSGCRAYLAMSGGILVEEVLGSRSTFLDGKMGGMNGRPLQSGDVLAAGLVSQRLSERRLPEPFIPRYGKPLQLRCVGGPQSDHFSFQTHGLFYESSFRVSNLSDRRGLRLEGPNLRVRSGWPPSIISEPNAPGGVQITPDGQAIILLKEQTTVGYPKISTVISVDFPWVAQAKPGDSLRFLEVSLQEAHDILRSWKRRWDELVSKMERQRRANR